MATAGVPQRFSPRERQIVNGLLEAKAVKDIAVTLELSVNTVKDYIKTIYRKADVHSARELMLKMENRPGAAPPESALAQLLQVAQNLERGGMPNEVLGQLGAAIRRCTRAQRVDFWRVVRSPADIFLVSEQGGATLPMNPFLRRVVEHGSGRMEPQEINGPEGRRLAAAGMRGELLGVCCSPTLRTHVVLASFPSDGAFGPLDLATMRLLARLAQGEPARVEVRSASAGA
ncbi:MAG TPA: helix-turn-helix transcriptional regulator [Terriglobales bacterium]|nr:helix-turn-helix transcriptional regulator [Terriglobales bacterium]